MKELNVNEYIYSKLNERGEMILRLNSIYSNDLIPDDEGFYKFQLWEFMQIFGKYLGMGENSISEGNSIHIKPMSFTKKKKEV